MREREGEIWKRRWPREMKTEKARRNIKGTRE